jgi:hypothetical protein
MRRCQSIPLSYRDCECWLPGNLRDRAFDARRRGHGCFRQKSLDRNPEENPVYGIVSEHLESFLARQRERDRPVPQFVERELRPFLDCGVLANGFLRVHCNVCRNDRVVPFSCKGRSVCSSRCGRRKRILCAINPPETIKKILDCLGLPSRPPLGHGPQPIYPAVAGGPFNF